MPQQSRRGGVRREIEDLGNQGAGNQGAGNQGAGNQGAGNQGAGNQVSVVNLGVLGNQRESEKHKDDN